MRDLICDVNYFFVSCVAAMWVIQSKGCKRSLLHQFTFRILLLNHVSDGNSNKIFPLFPFILLFRVYNYEIHSIIPISKLGSQCYMA